MSSFYDLHSHSWVSDGTLSPAELVVRAAAAGVGVLALTDHDDTAGIAEARATADEAGVGLVAGVEVSVSWNKQTVHIVGLGIDADHAPLQQGLERLRQFRDWRAEEIGRRLARHNLHGTYEAARALARGRIVSRTHFAHHLAAIGCGANVREVFKHYLRCNKPGHVPGQWAALEEAVDWITGAGGVAVIAHPARYGLSATKLRRLLGEFVDCGGRALEVVSGSHSPEETANMARLARQFELLASCGSDYHGPENPWVELGRLAPLPEGLTPVWAAWAPVGVGQPQRAELKHSVNA